jgi:hypothetical protein
MIKKGFYANDDDDDELGKISKDRRHFKAPSPRILFGGAVGLTDSSPSAEH